MSDFNDLSSSLRWLISLATKKEDMSDEDGGLVWDWKRADRGVSDAIVGRLEGGFVLADGFMLADCALLDLFVPPGFLYQ